MCAVRGDHDRMMERQPFRHMYIVQSAVYHPFNIQISHQYSVRDFC